MNRNRSKSRVARTMPLINPNAAAIDIGATMHMAAVGADRAPEPVRSFGTFTADLYRLVDWFTECGVETVVMESTSVYWIPIFELLDARGFTVFLVNARDAKHVPGRKTDVSDAQWLQRLHSFGLLRASFRPKGQIAELRSYVRQRERLLEYAASHIQHMQKALTEMNVQLHHVVADITGATGLCIIRAILAGERDPEVMASLRDSRCQASAETDREGTHRQLPVRASVCARAGARPLRDLAIRTRPASRKRSHRRSGRCGLRRVLLAADNLSFASGR
jgi:transposase